MGGNSELGDDENMREAYVWRCGGVQRMAVVGFTMPQCSLQIPHDNALAPRHCAH